MTPAVTAARTSLRGGGPACARLAERTRARAGDEGRSAVLASTRELQPELAACVVQDLQDEVGGDATAARHRVGADRLPGVEEEQLPQLISRCRASCEPSCLRLEGGQDCLQDEAAGIPVVASENEQRKQRRVAFVRRGAVQEGEQILGALEAAERGLRFAPARECDREVASRKQRPLLLELDDDRGTSSGIPSRPPSGDANGGRKVPTTAAQAPRGELPKSRFRRSRRAQQRWA